MEPISTFLLGTIISGILGNRSDAVFCKAVRLIRQRLRQASEPVNHDLQRAVRKAYLQAAYALIEARFQELGVAPDILQRVIQHVLHPSEEVRWLDKVRRSLRDELQRLPKAVYIPPAPEFEQEIELLLRPTSGRASERINQFKTRLKQYLINELQKKYGELPARIKEMIQQGWQGEGGQQLDWFDLLCAFFSEELKQNQRVANIFQSQLLAQLVVEGVRIDWKGFSAQLDSFSRPILERLEQISKSLESEFADLRARFDELLPILVVLKDLRKALDELARESKGKRLPLEVRRAMAFEVAWLTLLWMAEFKSNPNPSRIAAVKALLERLDLEQALDKSVEDYFTGKEEDLMQFANQIGGWLMATDPNVGDYFQACWNMLICVAKGQVWEIPNHIQKIEIPTELQELGEDPVAWLNALHAHFENTWQNYIREHSP